MPSQFHTPASDAWWPGEKRLMIAVLTDAIDIFVRGPGPNGSRRRGIFDETAAWVGSDDIGWPCSFVNICEALGLDPRSVRNALARQGQRRSGEPHRLRRRS